MKEVPSHHLRFVGVAVLPLLVLSCAAPKREAERPEPSGSPVAIATNEAARPAPVAYAHVVVDQASGYSVAWNDVETAVLSRTGERLARVDGGGGSPLFVPGSSLVALRGDGPDHRVRVAKLPSLEILLEAPNASVELHAGVHRLLVAEEDRAKGRWGFVSVFDTERAERVARAPLSDDGSGLAPARFGLSADGRKVSWALAATAVLDLDTGKTAFLERRPAAGAEPGAPIFTTDEKHVCVERDGVLTVLPMPNPAPGYEAHCFALPRSSAPGDSPSDADAIIANIIVSSGFRLLAPARDPAGVLVGDALSADRSLAVVTEISKRDPGSRSPLRLQLVVFDVRENKPRVRIPLGTVADEPTRWNVAVDTHAVAYCNGSPGVASAEACGRYDLASGARLKGDGAPLLSSVTAGR